MITELTTEEAAQLIETVLLIRDRLPHPIHDPREITLCWDGQTEASRRGSTALGQFSPWHPEQILLAEFARLTPMLIVPVLCHELHHCWQFHHYGVALYQLRATFGRRWLLERTAYQVQATAEKLLGQQ